MKRNLLLLFLIIPFLMNAQLEMDDFESYTVGSFDSQWDATQWVGWFGGPSGVEVSDEQAASGVHSIKVSESPSADDIVALLPVLDSGIHEVSFNQYIPADNGTYFNLQHNYTDAAGDWAVDVYFSDAAAAEGRLEANGEFIPFVVTYDTWVPLLFVLNFEAEEAQFFYNNSLIHTWVLSTGTGGGPALNAINAINFFAACNDDVGNCTSLAYYDDLLVEEGELPEFSLSLESDVLEVEYFATPLSQVKPLNLSATVSNFGQNNLNNISIIASVFDGNNNEVYSESLGVSAALATGESATLNNPANTFTPSEAGTYRVEYVATSDELVDIMDSNANNLSFNVSDDIYRRDDGNYINGFGSMGEPGLFGHSYEVVNPAVVTGINVTYAGSGVGETVQGSIMALSNTGVPTDIIATTEVVTITEAGGIGTEALLSMVFSSPVALQPGNYAFMVEQQGNTSLAISISEGIFTPRTSFLTIDNGNTWDALEAIGFNVSMAIHPVFGEGSVAVEEPDFAASIELNPTVTDGRATLSLELESTQDLLVEIYNIQGVQVYAQSLNHASGNVKHELDLSNQVSGMYFIAISSNGKVTTRKISLIK